MTRLSLRLVVLFLIALTALTGCSKKRAPSGPTGVMLDADKGAVLVVFPKTADFDRNEWLAMVNLVGPADTKSLPRIPMADLQSVLVLNIPPGQYHVSAQSWMRKSSPSTGGYRDGVQVEAGKVVIMRAATLPGIQTAEPTVPLTEIGGHVWSLTAPEKFHEYIANVVKDVVKG